jgi:hypothetical protein
MVSHLNWKSSTTFSKHACEVQPRNACGENIMEIKSVLGTQLYSLHSLGTRQIYKSTRNAKSEEPSTHAFREAFKTYNCKGMQQSLQRAFN